MATAWVYWKSEPLLWTVGYYAPNGEKYPADDFSSEQEAKDECHYLNGGERPDRLRVPMRVLSAGERALHGLLMCKPGTCRCNPVKET